MKGEKNQKKQPHATIFAYTSYRFEPQKKRIVFRYRTHFSDASSMIFEETIVLPKVPRLDGIDKNLIKKLLESVHLILGISYYKFYYATDVKVPYRLSTMEADFWNTVYRKGLGEFCYQNNLDPKRLAKFKGDATVVPKTYALEHQRERALIGIGGGKDSIVVGELLKSAQQDSTAFVVESGPSVTLIDDVINIMGIKKLCIRRLLDKKVYDTHRYNGHIPISAIYAFLGTLAGVLYQYRYVVVGNEYSSNFGNLQYRGEDINHQWSKSFAFEQLFQRYSKTVLTPHVTYISLLRRMYEIKIVEKFSHYPAYFQHFSSCNRNFSTTKQRTTGLWCGECAKCVFAFILLSAFLPPKDLLGIFHKNLYEDEALLPLFRDVVGLGTMKPFDCVGTFEEAQTALTMAEKKFAETVIMRQLAKSVQRHDRVFEIQKEHAMPEPLLLASADRVLILGYGKEGKVTETYIKTQYPQLVVGVGDASLDKTYLDHQGDFDVAIKTPGLKKELVTIPYTTATNIFFSQVLGKNTIIGVTGSKGKSTTSSLIYHILKTAGHDVVLLGNIGKPMLEALMKPIPRKRIFVLELSSYQLDDIHYSPDIAVVTNLFPEHMDYHGGLAPYYRAKRHIIDFQTAKNYFVYNPDNKEMLSWLDGYRGKAVSFVKKKYTSHLLGKHNESNIGAAARVARLFAVSDATIQKALHSFHGLRHRLELIGVYRGIRFYDDAISTTPDSTMMALSSIPKIETIFLGGEDRGYDFRLLEKTILKMGIKNIVLFPESGEKLFQAVQGLHILKTRSMKEAVAFAYHYTSPGGACVLSCASPSYSLWKNFEEKGDEFTSYVKSLA